MLYKLKVEFTISKKEDPDLETLPGKIEAAQYQILRYAEERGLELEIGSRIIQLDSSPFIARYEVEYILK